MQFRVHKSILSIHSTVFADMFAMPQPPKRKRDSLPIIKLEGDLMYQWRWLLQLLYDGRRFVWDT
jgi:BTB/POZ domain